MRKYMLSLFLVLTLLFAMPKVYAKENLPKVDHDPINVYIFRGDNCSYCHSALEYFELAKEKYGDYFKLVGFEVSDTKNSEFWQTVGEHFGDEVSGIPYIVVGDAYHAAGFEEAVGDKIIKIILEQYKNPDYVDVVMQLLKDNKLDKAVKYEQNTDFTILQNANLSTMSNEKDKENSSDIFIIIGIFVVLIGGIAGLVVASKKK